MKKLIAQKIKLLKCFFGFHEIREIKNKDYNNTPYIKKCKNCSYKETYLQYTR